ncbi:MAG: DUF72 domain-containing protein [Solirubrobacterales bacterium]|nr:DUF72 domain-containing protein [Solirubrobacterales bacterium]
MPPIRIGCSGWIYRSWAGDFYPERCPQRLWLEHYASVFDTVELNNTFYRLPRREVVEAWTRRMPPDFTFTIKSSRYLTHMKRLTDMDQGVRNLWERLDPLILDPRRGPILWQLPGSFHRNDDRLAHALEHLPTEHGERHAFEFRHPSWFVPEVMDLLRAHDVALAIGDRPERPFQTHELTTDFTIVRFHYGHRGRRGNYSETELREWAARLRDLATEATVFAYFNNDWEVFAPRNARRLRQLLSRA